ncbi:hypothetical protein [Pectobacterium brasiliense]|uniref:hypothetical protein n=1 Tax=Pectobacterium brasiliense TaxID=180957 RepID=UPI001968AACD|nr:hypothetical protein [Pectobacterium brasiliense]
MLNQSIKPTGYPEPASRKPPAKHKASTHEVLRQYQQIDFNWRQFDFQFEELIFAMASLPDRPAFRPFFGSDTLHINDRSLYRCSTLSMGEGFQDNPLIKLGDNDSSEVRNAPICTRPIADNLYKYLYGRFTHCGILDAITVRFTINLAFLGIPA